MPLPLPITALNETSKASSRSSEILNTLESETCKFVGSLQKLAIQGQRLCLSCIPSAEGMLTAVGALYLARVPEECARLIVPTTGQARLDEVYLSAPCDATLATYVFEGFIRATFGAKGMPQYVRDPKTMVTYIAAQVQNPSMPEILHRYVRCGFTFGKKIGTHGADPLIAEAEALATSTSSEAEHLRQFVRFSRLADGSFFAQFRPKADVVPLAAGYFKRRMGEERFCLLDPVHGSAALYGDHHLGIMKLDPLEAELLASQTALLAQDEPYVRALWKGFYDAVTLPHRTKMQRGYDLRQQFMPQRLWAYLPELDPRTDTAWTWIPPIYRGNAPLASKMLNAPVGKRESLPASPEETEES